MGRRIFRAGRMALALAAIFTAPAGCIDADELEDLIDEVGDELEDLFDEIQESDPRLILLPDEAVDRGNTVIIQQDVEIITVVNEQITVEELPDLTLLAFENLSGADLYVRYSVDGVVQAVFIFDGETLLLDYECLDEVELIRQEEFDPFTGVFIDGFDLLDGLFLNDVDFICGDALIFTFDEFGPTATVEPVEL
ncbi:MAG: hypothetical protein CHACPFDD_02957 [Phycisphaerae bacterium]|nr:hypothetical protein [Phycisphaerae bacterium]